MTDYRKDAKPNGEEEDGDTSCTWCCAFGSLDSALGEGIKKSLPSNRVFSGAVESKASLPLIPVCLCREQGAAKLGDDSGCLFPTWMSLPSLDVNPDLADAAC